MNLGFGRGPVVAIVCVLCLAASACGASDGERRGNETVVPPSTADSTGAVPTTNATTGGTGVDTNTSDTSTSTVIRTGTDADPADTSTGNGTITGTDADTDTADAGTGVDTSNDTDTDTGTDMDSASTSTTAAPSEIAVSPWPQDPRTAQDRDWQVQIEAHWAHDTDAFTQGLETDGGTIYESTGLYGESRLRALDGATELRSVALDPELFGEGLTLLGDEIIQLSWRAGRALRWDRDTFEPRGEFRYQGEGWGICWDEGRSRLLMSDGTSTLTHRDRDDFSVVTKITVTRNNEPVARINELECVEGLVVANIWMSNEIIVIDPDSGEVLVSIDAALLAAEAGVSASERDEVLNGIAYNGDGTWILGGKNWPVQFLVTLSLD